MLNLQYFAEEAISGENEVTPDAGENKEKSFDELVEGDYRDEYKSRVEAIVKHRLKDYSSTKQALGELTDLISSVGAKLGVSEEDPKEILRSLEKAGETENCKAEEAFSQNEEEGNESVMPELSCVEDVKALAEKVKQAREVYPDFDIVKELRDPVFTMLLRVCENDPKRAYEMKYHDLILTNAMQYAVQTTENRLANSLATKVQRPAENASMGNAAVVIGNDPKSLTKAQRSEIKKRVRRGEKILW